ncbi:MAG: deazaflavin-dependent oxidoreductase (nitroreductase family) [Halieaceae bacterium]|jgi:deazaflavin-dependent oxidoreductase (nitroreductase family)
MDNTTQPANKPGGDAPPPRWVLKTYTKVNVFVYRLSGGRLMNKLAGIPIMLVKMTGAKSGKIKYVPLMYVPHEAGYVVVASQGGAPKNPVWYNNLVKHPEVEITYAGVTKQLTARQVDDVEKAALWPTCVKHYPPYEDYQQRTDRNIPVFVCE